MKKKIIKVINLFLVLTLLTSCAYIINHVYKAKQEAMQFEHLVEEMENAAEVIVQSEEVEDKINEELRNPIFEEIIVKEETEEEVKQTILLKYENLYRQNTDMMGWIKIEDTNINYPVMQTEITNPTFYINRDFAKEESVSGIPFIDSRCTLESENVIIYSHNMKNGTMFGELKKYKEAEFYKNHRIVNFDTIYEEHKYEVVAIMLTKVDYYGKSTEEVFEFYNYIELDLKEKFDEYVMIFKEQALYETGVSAEYGDKLITLVTCDYHTEDGRLLILAKQIQ